MNKYTLFRENEDATDGSQGRKIGQFDDSLILISYLASLDQNEIWLYRVTEWFTGHEGNWPEDVWEINNQWRADEWLEDRGDND